MRLIEKPEISENSILILDSSPDRAELRLERGVFRRETREGRFLSFVLGGETTDDGGELRDFSTEILVMKR